MILFVFGLWFVLTMAMFVWLSPRRAVLASLIGGWAILPTADYSAISHLGDEAFATLGMGSAYLSMFWLTKSTVIGISTLVGVLVFDSRVFKHFRPRLFDLPILIWCLVPALSVLRNDLTVQAMGMGVSYHMVAWGIPYLLGRVYFNDLKPLHELCIALVMVTMVYVPLCLIEIVAGPVFYNLVYGYQPYLTDGIERTLGFRPIVLLEHGNQLGIWMAGGALIAFWLQRIGKLPRLLSVAPPVIVAGLVLTSIFCQSLGAVVLLLASMGLYELIRRGKRIPKWAIVLVLLGSVLLGGLLFGGGARLVGQFIGEHNVQRIRSVSRLRTLGWRLNGEAINRDKIAQRPLLGWGQWDWWQQVDPDRTRVPWSLIGLSAGMFGMVGTGALIALFVVPIVMFIRSCPPAYWLDVNLGPPAALVVLLGMALIDNLINPTFCTIWICIAGGLNTICPYLKKALKPN